MVPDLPYVRKDVPDGSEALKHGNRFARFARSLLLRVRSASKGTTTARPSLTAGAASRVGGGSVRPRVWVAALAVVVSTAVSVTLFAPMADADSLSDQRTRVKQQLAQTRNELSESSHALTRAGVAVDRAQSALDFARDRLAQTRRELGIARAKDVAMAAKLKQARADLAAAKAAVIAGQAALDAQQATAGEMMRDQYQQQNNLLPIAALIGTDSTEDLQTRMQWSTTMFDTAQAQIDKLTEIQRQLTAAKARQAALEAQIAADRREARANLKVKTSLKAKAASQKAAVVGLVLQRRAVEASAAKHVAQDKARYAKLTRERATVEHRIAVRIAKAKAARQRAARRAAVRAAAEARRAQRASKKSSAPSRRSVRSKSVRSKSVTEQYVKPCGRSRFRVPGIGLDHLVVRSALPSGPALLEAA